MRWGKSEGKQVTAYTCVLRIWDNGSVQAGGAVSLLEVEPPKKELRLCFYGRMRMSWIALSAPYLTRLHPVNAGGIPLPVDSSGEVTRMFYAGIDIAKRKHEISTIDTEGRPLSQSFSFTNDREGSDRLLALFDRLSISPQELAIGMEATGLYWLSLYSWLLEKGYDVKVINPIQSDAFRDCPSARPGTIRKTRWS